MTPENKTLAPRLIKFPGEEEKLALLSMLNTGISPGTTLNPDANNTGGTIPLSSEYAPNEGAQGIEERANEYADGRYGAGTATTNLWNDAKIGFVAGAKSQHIVSTLAERDRVVKIVESAIYIDPENPNDKYGLTHDGVQSILAQITNGGTVEGNDGIESVPTSPPPYKCPCDGNCNYPNCSCSWSL